MTISVPAEEIQQRPQDDEVVLSVQGVSKKFCRGLRRSLFYGAQDIAAELLGVRGRSERLRPQEFWALKDVSFELRRGETLGLIGPNGSGKTTLLRIISGLIRPDEGAVEIAGRVAPLIALGAGFNPILTGRENIYANMSILGLSKLEIDQRFDQVVEFAEIEDAIDAPVQTYSSGMAARLGFASAIHTEPDILLIDEVLAVGDVQFRAKCFRKLNDLRQKNVSFVLVSHSSNAILLNCKSAIYLSKGKLISYGDADSVMSHYEEDLFLRGQKPKIARLTLPERSESKILGLGISSIFFRGDQGNVLEFPESGKPTSLCLVCCVYRKISNACIHLVVKELLGESEIVLTFNNLIDNNLIHISPGKQEIQVKMPYLGLKPNQYTMQIIIREGPLFSLDEVQSFRFTVTGDMKNKGVNLFNQPYYWKVEDQRNASIIYS